jgi:hypothetical protein
MKSIYSPDDRTLMKMSPEDDNSHSRPYSPQYYISASFTTASFTYLANKPHGRSKKTGKSL